MSDWFQDWFVGIGAPETEGDYDAVIQMLLATPLNHWDAYCYNLTLYRSNDGFWERFDEEVRNYVEIEPTFKIENLPLKHWLQDALEHSP